MKNTTKIFISLTFLFLASQPCFSQQEGDTTVVEIDENTNQTIETDPVKAKIIDIIKEVNRRSEMVDNIISSGDVKVKVPPKKGQEEIDQSGSIEIHVKKKDDVWFDLTGTF